MNSREYHKNLNVTIKLLSRLENITKLNDKNYKRITRENITNCVHPLH